MDASYALVGPAGVGKTWQAEQLGAPVVRAGGCVDLEDLIAAVAHGMGLTLPQLTLSALEDALTVLVVLDGVDGCLEDAVRLAERVPVVLTCRRRPALPCVEVEPWSDEASARFLGEDHAELLAQLDGLPLALELAKRRLRVLTPDQLVTVLKREGLGRGLDAVVLSSWQAISDGERACLRSLAWHAGPFDLAQVEDVDALLSLVDGHLIRPVRSGWFSLFATVRAFVRRQGAEDRSAELAKRAYGLLASPMAPESSDILAAFAGDLRTAFRACLKSDPDAASQAALALDHLYKARGPVSARPWILTRALEAGGRPDEVWLTAATARVVPFERRRTEALASHPTLSAWASRLDARHALLDGDVERALERARQAVRDGPTDPRNHVTLGEACSAVGEGEEAIAHMLDGLKVARARGAQEEASVLGFLSITLQNAGQLDRAATAARQAIAALERASNPRRALISKLILADIELESGLLVEAEQTYKSVDGALAAIGERRWRSAARAGAAMARALAGERDSSELRAALDDARLVDPPAAQAKIELWLGILLGACEDWEGAVGVLERLREPAGARTVAEAWLASGRGLAPQLNLERQWCTEVRVAGAWVKRLLANRSSTVPDLRVGPGASWFEVAGRPRQSLAKRHANRRVFAALVSAHRENELTADQLLQAGWPGERVVASAGSARVYTALATLRRWGLRGLIEKTEAGYRIRADAVLQLDPEPTE